MSFIPVYHIVCQNFELGVDISMVKFGHSKNYLLLSRFRMKENESCSINQQIILPQKQHDDYMFMFVYLNVFPIPPKNKWIFSLGFKVIINVTYCPGLESHQVKMQLMILKPLVTIRLFTFRTFFSIILGKEENVGILVLLASLIF